MNNKIEYFLNAVHYCMWLHEKKEGKFVQRISKFMAITLPKFFMSKNHKSLIDKRVKNSSKDYEDFYYNRKTGYYVYSANHWFGYICTLYFMFLSFVALGCTLHFYGSISKLYLLLIVMIPIEIGYIPVYKSVFSKDKYLEYFKKFEKEDERWYKKWRRITIVFCLGGIIVALSGIASAFAIITLMD